MFLNHIFSNSAQLSRVTAGWAGSPNGYHSDTAAAGFYRRNALLSPNKQRQSTEVNLHTVYSILNFILCDIMSVQLETFIT